MKQGSISLMLGLVVIMLLAVTCSMQDTQYKQVKQVDEVNLVEFELVRDSLYDYAMTICEGLAECDGSCFYTDVDEEYVNEFKECRVPSLESLLYILDQIDNHGSVWDVYDDDEGTVFEYYTLRERYENYF